MTTVSTVNLQFLDPTFAEGFARAAHWGQTEKGGAPYAGHLERCALAVPYAYRALVWMHDVPEDTKYDLLTLFVMEMPAGMLMSLGIMTKPPKAERGPDWTYVGWVESIIATRDWPAIWGKTADVEDHLREGCLEVLTTAKVEEYTVARELLRQACRDFRREMAADLIARTIYGDAEIEDIERAAKAIASDRGYREEKFGQALIRRPRDRQFLLTARDALNRQ